MNKGSIRRITALAMRIVRQFARDRRTLAMIFILPMVVMGLMTYLLEGPPTEIPFALIKSTSEDSLVYNIVNSVLEEEERVVLISVGIDEYEQSLRDGRISGAMIISGGSQDDMTDGSGVQMKVYLEGSDVLATKELVMLLARITRRLMPAVRDIVNALGSDTDVALASIEPVVPEYIYGDSNFGITDYFAPIILAVFPFILTFLLTSVSFLRERTSGTMERLLASPIGRIEVIAGYLLGFLIFTLAQAAVVLGFVLLVLKVHQAGNILLLFAVVVLITVVASGLGIFLSSFAKTELQVAQFMPLVMFPLVLLSGVLWPVETMPKWLQPLGYASPLTWAIFTLRDVMIKGFGLIEVMKPAGILILFSIAFVLLAAATLRRQVD